MSGFRGRGLSRRAVLRGAGVALSLPWLESLASSARAQELRGPTRFLPIFLPHGAPELWKPPSLGLGDDWQLSSVLEPLLPLKDRLTVICGLENASVFNADGSSSVEPAHGRQSGAWLTCVDGANLAQRLGVAEANGISVDQVLAAHRRFANMTGLPSLQVGLSTTASSCDGRPCSYSRSISWQTETKPLYKLVAPQEVFDSLSGVVQTGQVPPDVKERLRGRQSVLDAVKESASLVKPKLSRVDQQKLDEFLTSVREMERRTLDIPQGHCIPLPRPSFPRVTNESFRTSTETYDKALHADLMNDLVAWAFQCDATRVISYMLEDKNSEFSYDHVPRRAFTATGSTPSAGVCGDYSSVQHGLQDDFASITWWNVQKVSELCQRLAQIDDGGGFSVLDNSVVFLGAAMHGSNHQCNDLPALLLGGGGGKLKTNQHVQLGERPLRDLYVTLMNGVFEMEVASFGENAAGAPLAEISELLR